MRSTERPALTQLVFLDRGPLALRALVVVAVAAAAGVAGDALYRLEAHLDVQRVAGASLNPVQNLLANGSSIRTAWVGWLAALFFIAAALRVRRGPLEPAAGRASLERLNATQLRSGLRREYLLVRLLLVAVALVAAVDCARACAIAIAAARLDASVAWAVAEAAGLVAAGAALALWAWWFGADLRRLAAI